MCGGRYALMFVCNNTSVEKVNVVLVKKAKGIAGKRESIIMIIRFAQISIFCYYSFGCNLLDGTYMFSWNSNMETYQWQKTIIIILYYML